MAKAINLELYAGELDGVYQKLYIVTSDNGNFFEIEPHCMAWKQNNRGHYIIPDFKESKLKHIQNTRHAKITIEMLKIREINPSTGMVTGNKSNQAEKLATKSNRSKGKGMSM